MAHNSDSWDEDNLAYYVIDLIFMMHNGFNFNTKMIPLDKQIVAPQVVVHAI